AAEDPSNAVACHGVDIALGHGLAVDRAAGTGHHPDPAVLDIGDHQVVGLVHRRHTALEAQLGSGSRAGVAGESSQGGAVHAAHGVDVPNGHHLPVEGAGG